jgi:glucose/arabinose dehydrogenase
VKGGALLTTPFVTVSTTANGERGLLGVAFHPQFGTAGNNYVYVYYTSASGSTHNRISRYPTTAAGDVSTGPEEVIFDLLPTLGATNHNGGAIHFGPDGKLYVAVGENADPFMSPSNTSFLGKVLRLNPDGSIPADNPSLGTGNFKAIWAKGFRNPFTFSFQPGTGLMLINDVGESTWEEVNPGVAGANYGWPNSEGTTNNAGITNPIFTYNHGSNPTLVVGQAIVGSAFYNPATASFGADYVGSYFFGDYVQGWINRIDLTNGNTAVYAFARGLNTVTDIAIGPDGALYAATILSGGSFGVYRFSKP